MPLWAQTVHVCVCTYVCMCVCVLIPSLSAPSLVLLHAFQKEQAPDSPLAACMGQGVVENPLYSISRTCWILGAKGFPCQESGSQVQGCAVNYSLSPLYRREPCPYAAMNCVLRSIIGLSLWRQMSTVILPPLLFIPKPLRTNLNRPYVRLAGGEESKHSPCFRGRLQFFLLKSPELPSMRNIRKEALFSKW